MVSSKKRGRNDRVRWRSGCGTRGPIVHGARHSVHFHSWRVQQGGAQHGVDVVRQRPKHPGDAHDHRLRLRRLGVPSYSTVLIIPTVLSVLLSGSAGACFALLFINTVLINSVLVLQVLVDD